MKDPWTWTTRVEGGLNVGVDRTGESNGKMGTTVIEQQ